MVHIDRNSKSKTSEKYFFEFNKFIDNDIIFNNQIVRDSKRYLKQSISDSDIIKNEMMKADNNYFNE